MKVLIIVPAYNEAKNLIHVIEHLKHICPQYDYIIVNDGSTDGTKEICRENGYPVINHPVNRGLTETIRTGMKYALENGYEMALQFDADGQHLPEYIACMIQCMKEKNCDIVIASRFLETGMPVRMRTVGGKMISAAIWMTAGKYLTDPTSGMRLYRRNIIRLFAENTDFRPEPDTIAYLIRMGAHVQEVKVEMKERKTGQSYLTPVNASKYMIRVLSSILFFQWLREDRKVTKDTENMTEPHHYSGPKRPGRKPVKKKICFFSGDITRSGGTERVAIQLANTLQEDNTYDICFISLTEQQKNTFYPLHPEIRRYRLGNKWLNPGPAYIPLIGKLRRFLKNRQIDIIIDIDIVLDVLSIPAARRLKTKVISWEHFNCEFEQKILYRRLISRLTVHFSDYIVTLTKEDKENFRKMLGRKAQISAIYNLVSEMKRDEDVLREQWIVTVGRLTYQKGIEYLVKVAVPVLKKHRDWKWLVLGDGEDRKILEQAISEHNLEEQLILKGTVNQVEWYLNRARLFVLTSRYEGFGMCLAEAMQMHVPCVSFDIKIGPSEIITNHQNGILVPPFQCKQMIQEINSLIENPGRLEELSANTKIGFERYQKDHIKKQWEYILDKLS